MQSSPPSPSQPMRRLSTAPPGPVSRSPPPSLQKRPFKAMTTRRDLSTSWKAASSAWASLEGCVVLKKQCARLGDRSVEILVAVEEVLSALESSALRTERGKSVYEFDGKAGSDSIFKVQAALLDVQAFAADFSSAKDQLSLLVHGIPHSQAAISTLTKSLSSLRAFYSLPLSTASWPSEDAQDLEEDLAALPRLFRVSVALRGDTFDEYVRAHPGEETPSQRRPAFLEWCFTQNPLLRPLDGEEVVRQWSAPPSPSSPSLPPSPSSSLSRPLPKRSSSAVLVPYAYGPSSGRPLSLHSEGVYINPMRCAPSPVVIAPDALTVETCVASPLVTTEPAADADDSTASQILEQGIPSPILARVESPVVSEMSESDGRDLAADASDGVTNDPSSFDHQTEGLESQPDSKPGSDHLTALKAPNPELSPPACFVSLPPLGPVTAPPSATELSSANAVPLPEPEREGHDRKALLAPLLTFRAATPSSEPPSPRSPSGHLRILCLDGGGIRGLPLLLTLRAALNLSGSPSRPCEEFDLIAGTGTGGLVALLLGRMRLTIDDAISVYTAIAEKAFFAKPRGTPKSSRFSRLFGGKGNSSLAGSRDSALQKVLEAYLPHQPMRHLLAMNDCSTCKTAIISFKLEGRGTTPTPHLARSYAGGPSEDLLSRDVIVATLASTPFFKPTSAFVAGRQNPSFAVLEEVKQIWGEQAEIGCFLSVGVGRVAPSARKIKSRSRAQMLKMVCSLADDAEAESDRFRAQCAREGWEDQYLRYNVAISAPVDSGIEEYLQVTSLKIAIEQWMQKLLSYGSSSQISLRRELHGFHAAVKVDGNAMEGDRGKRLHQSSSLSNLPGAVYLHEAAGSTGSLSV